MDKWLMVGMSILCCLIAFAVGGIPFGYFAGRIVLRDDIRKFGSGNIGATNVMRLLGWKWGAAVLVLDALKGLIPTWGIGVLLRWRGYSDGIAFAQLAVGVSAILGHMYPVWLRLRGGKGVATALGVILVIFPEASAVAIGTYLVLVATLRVSAIASIAATIGFAVTQLSLLGRSALDAQQLPLSLFSILMPALIIWRHRSNILRLLHPQKDRSVEP